MLIKYDLALHLCPNEKLKSKDRSEIYAKNKHRKGWIVLAKKYNKSRKQKPNYSNRGMTNVNVEAGADLEVEREFKDNACERTTGSICDRTNKKR